MVEGNTPLWGVSKAHAINICVLSVVEFELIVELAVELIVELAVELINYWPRLF